MKIMVIFLRSNDIITDSRVIKYLDFFEKENISYKIIGWDREKKDIKLKNSKFYKKKTGYNLGKKAISNRILWIFFLLKELKKERKNYSVIHACDFDTIIPALIMKILYKKKVIFDIFDWFSDTIITNNILIDKLINFLEKKSVKLSNFVIICEEERKKQIGIRPQKLFILPNIPNVNFNYLKKGKKSNFLKVSYVGGLYRDRNIEILLKAASENKKLILEIAGFGDKQLEALCKTYSENFLNIQFYGRVKYSEGLKIMANSDVIYAMYCKTNENHIFAAPNKYYESLMLGKPLITTKNTIVGEKVEKYNTGFVIEETENETSNLFSEISEVNFDEKIKNCKKLWDKKYKNYVDIFFKEKYIKEILELKKHNNFKTETTTEGN